MRFRKKPVEIEAMQVPLLLVERNMLDKREQLDDWLLANSGDRKVRYVGDNVEIETLEGTMTAQPGDWIIKGVAGELYPCKPDIFAQTYEPAEWTK